MSTLFVCDRPEHGYGCYHLEEAMQELYSWNLSRKEQAQWDALVKHGYDVFTTLDDIDEEIEEARRKQDRAMETYEEYEAEEEDLRAYRGLFLKRLDEGGMG